MHKGVWLFCVCVFVDSSIKMTASFAGIVRATSCANRFLNYIITQILSGTLIDAILGHWSYLALRNVTCKFS